MVFGFQSDHYHPRPKLSFRIAFADRLGFKGTVGLLCGHDGKRGEQESESR